MHETRILSTIAFLAIGALSVAQEPDVVIRGGMVIDGTGADPRRADVAVRNGRIVAVGDLSSARASRIIDASGLYVGPGFIDIHSHADTGLSDPYLATAANNLLQGITTVVVGQDGRHAWPLGGSLSEQVALWRRQGVGNNVVPLAGQGSARIEVMGWIDQPASEAERQAIADHVAGILAEGAWGLSSGLGYYPGRHSPPDEVVDAARPVAAIDGFYISHMRNQGDMLLESIEETIHLSKETGVRAVATHIKASPKRNWGKARPAVAQIAEARANGVKIYADLYPYDTSSDGIDVSLVPIGALFEEQEMRELLAPAGTDPGELLRWAFRLEPNLGRRFDLDFLLENPQQAFGNAVRGTDRLRGEAIFRHRLRERLADPETSPALLEAVLDRISGPGGAEIFEIASHPEERLVGLRLSELARARGISEARAAVELTLEGASFTQLHMSDDDVVTYIQQPFMAACTDGWVPEYGFGLTHPRSYGAFTRRIRRYVYDLGVIDLPFAIQTATGLPAEIIGLGDRGLIEEGQWADLIAFDPARIRDRATYRNPHLYSEGIEWVLVNGDIVVEDGEVNGHRAGKVLLKTDGSSTSN
ncbi:MAG TPA: amidohydrolase family protein [Vicinamibacteria bacterium]|nr:amidohydrolase family protein [Vicinamibacteria bacterium]